MMSLPTVTITEIRFFHTALRLTMMHQHRGRVPENKAWKVSTFHSPPYTSEVDARSSLALTRLARPAGRGEKKLQAANLADQTAE